MIDPLDFENRHLIDKLARKRKIALLVLLFEQMSLHFWRLFFWALLFFALWMIQVPAFFGPPGALATLGVFLGGCIYFFLKDARHFEWPSKKEIDRRLEKAGNLRHRPISSLQDDLSNPEKFETRTLWEDSKARMLAALSGLKIPMPNAFTAKKDPYAIRLGIILLFIVGLSISGPRWNERIWNGLTPVSYTLDFKKADGISLWITPPEYTGISQIILEGSGKNLEAVKIPAGSKVKIRVTGGLGHPSLKTDSALTPLEHLGDDSYGLEMEMPPGTHFSIRQMYITRSRWEYELIPDTPPAIEAKTPHEILQNGQTRFPLVVTDDYGVKDITMTMTLDPVVDEAPLGEPAVETRSVMSPPGAAFEIQPIYDLTPHSWAGLPVVITLSITDHIGQQATLAPVKMILPERKFLHPVAKALIEERKILAWEPDVTTSRDIARRLEQFLIRPSAFGDDIVVFLAIRTASSRLYYSPTKESAKAVISLLWDTALRIEDGNLTLAARNLRDAQNALENALSNPAITDQEIAKLMSELRSAMAEYLMELQKELQKRLAQDDGISMIPPEMLASMLDPEALSSFLDQMESQMMSGNKDAAQEMLSQLQRMMDMMDPSMATPLPMDMQMMMEGVSELQELIDRQQELLDQTKGQMEISDVLQKKEHSYGETLEPNMSLFDKWGLAMEDMPPPPSFDRQGKTKEITINTQTNKTEQEALRFILGQLMLEAGEKLEEIPENMGLAEQEMRLSSNELGENKPGLSIPHQEKAIEHLKESMEQLSQQLVARIQQMTGMSLSGGMKMDPLGRPFGGDGDRPGLFPGSRVKIPDEAQRKNVEQILKLLRRRSGELDRPDYELDYYRRLLRQF